MLSVLSWGLGLEDTRACVALDGAEDCEGVTGKYSLALMLLA